MRQLFRELKRRNVYRVAVTYAAAAFVTLQAARLIFPATTLEGLYDKLVVLAFVGFPIALVIAWAFELTPEGVRRTREVERRTPAAEDPGDGTPVAKGEPAAEGRSRSHLPLQALIVLGLVAGAAAGGWYLVGSGGETEPTPRAGERSLAVLPFEALGEGEAGTFTEGMHDALLTRLSNVGDLTVISRTSVQQYRDTEKTTAEIARELGVKWVMEGGVQEMGDRIQVNAQLIDPRTDAHAWAESYRRDLTTEDLFAIQSEITKEIAGSLEARLTEGERDRVEETPTDDLAAYEAFLRGRSQFWQFLGQWRPDLVEGSIENLRAAVAADPDFAEAHAWLGMAYTYRGPDEQWLDSAKVAVRRARQIDSGLPSVHLARAFVYAWQDSAAAEVEAYRRVIALQPGNALARAELSEDLVGQDEPLEALRLAREAVRLDPRRPWILQEMADQLRHVRLYEAAEAWDRHILEIEPTYFGAYNGLSRTLLESGQPERALSVWEDYFRRSDDPAPGAYFLASLVALDAGEFERARAYVERISGVSRRQTTEPRPGGPDRRTDVWLRTLGSVPPVIHGVAELRLGREARGREILVAAVDSLRREIARGEGSVGAKRDFLARALAALGRTEEALREVERLVESYGPRAVAGIDRGDPLYDSLRAVPWIRETVRKAEARQERYRQKALAMGLDFYPPGAGPDAGTGEAGADG